MIRGIRREFWELIPSPIQPISMPIMGFKELNIDQPYHSQGLKKKERREKEGEKERNREIERGKI